MKKFLIILALLIVGVLLLIVFARKSGQREPEIVSPSSVEEHTGPPEGFVDPLPNDADRDGIDDAQESELGTSAVQFDTDGDGISDSDEINVWQSDPTKKDTDGDGFADGWEIIEGYNPVGPGRL